MMGKSNHMGVIVAAIAFAAVALGFAWYTNNQPQLDPKETEREAEQITRDLKPVQPKTPADYDWAKSIENLKTIGEAMLKYRAVHPSLTVSQRKSWHEAGLPEHLYLALTETGHLWTIPQETFIAPTPHEPYTEKRIQKGLRHSDYDQQYALGSFSLDEAAKIQQSWAKKGEYMIVLSDNSMHSSAFLSPNIENSKQMELLVLRLNGKVERIRIDSHSWGFLASNY